MNQKMIIILPNSGSPESSLFLYGKPNSPKVQFWVSKVSLYEQAPATGYAIIQKNKATIGRIDILNRMVNLYVEYQKELSWLGGNFNQAMKRAEMEQDNKPFQSYYDEVLLPLIGEIQELLHNIKEEQQIAKILTKP